MTQAPDSSQAPRLRRLVDSMDYDEAASFLEKRFAGYLTAGSDQDLKAAYAFDPHRFGGKFPTLSVEEDGSTYEGASDRSRLPGAILFSVRIFQPSLVSKSRTGGTPTGAAQENVEWKDGRAEAKHMTRKIHGRWREALLADLDLRRLVKDVRITTTEAGDMDAMGNSRADETGRSILWVHRSIVQVMP